MHFCTHYSWIMFPPAIHIITHEKKLPTTKEFIQKNSHKKTNELSSWKFSLCASFCHLADLRTARDLFWYFLTLYKSEQKRSYTHSKIFCFKDMAEYGFFIFCLKKRFLLFFLRLWRNPTVHLKALMTVPRLRLSLWLFRPRNFPRRTTRNIFKYVCFCCLQANVQVTNTTLWL